MPVWSIIEFINVRGLIGLERFNGRSVVALSIPGCQLTAMAIQIHRILHAGYYFSYRGLNLLFDPIFENPFSYNCFAFPDIQFDLKAISSLKISAIFISHSHDDHCSFESLQHLDRTTPVFIFCRFEKMQSLLRELGFQKVQNLELDSPLELGPFKVTPRRAAQLDIDSLLQIQVGELNILNVVDSEIDPETMSLLRGEPRWDLILWPFQVMRETEVLDPRRALSLPVRNILVEMAAQIKLLRPRFLVPSSCQFQMENGSWYNQAFFAVSYQEFSEVLKEILLDDCPSIIRMNPGVGYELSSHSLLRLPNLEWVQPVGEQDLDYSYDAKLVAPSTSEIARRMPALTDLQRLTLKNYLSVTLPLRYHEIGPPGGLYFNRKVQWELRTYDDLGCATSHWYEINEEQLRMRSAPIPASQPVSNGLDLDMARRRATAAVVATPARWRTDISEYKLLSAFESGEALNSIYLRVNDCEYDRETEEKLKCADVMMDPLIRCLYDGVFGSYQEGQLCRIRESD